MDGWTLIPAMILLTISALGVFRHWRNLPDDELAKDSWCADTTVDLAIKDDARPLPPRDIQREEREFHRRQFRRRLQGSLMIGALGLLLPVGGFIQGATWNIAYLALLLSLLGWMLLLGIADLVATRHNFNRVREQLLSDMLSGIKPEMAGDATSSEAPAPRPPQ